MSEVKGVILAGGYGKRLLPLTQTTPKPLLEIKDGYPILEKLLFSLSAAGVKETYLLIAYMADKVRETIGDERFGMKLHYVKEEKPVGNRPALANVLKGIDSDIILLYGDEVSDHNLGELVRVSRESDDLMTMTLVEMRSPYGVIETHDRKVTSFREKPKLDLMINAGYYYVKKECFPFFLEDYPDNALEKTVFPMLVEKRKVGMFFEPGVFWQSVDSLKDLQRAQDEYVNKIDTLWGYEKMITGTDNYLVKELYIKKGFEVPIPSSNAKSKSIHVISGEGKLKFADGSKDVSALPGAVIPVGSDTHYTISANENLKIYEYSAPQRS